MTTKTSIGEWQTFIVSMSLILGSFYGLFFATGIAADQRGGLFGILGLVASYFLNRNVAEATATKVMAAVNGGSKP